MLGRGLRALQPALGDVDEARSEAELLARPEPTTEELATLATRPSTTGFATSV
jgi:hypothetical protein